MRRDVAVGIVVLLGVTALAGCLGTQAPGPARTEDDADPAGRPVDTRTGGVDAATAARTPHVHDLWRGRQAITLFDDDLQVNATTLEPTADGPAYQNVGPNDCYESDFDIGAWCLGRAVFGVPASEDPDEPRVVPPGTWAISATATWEDPTITGVRLEAIGANGEEIWMGDQLASGESTRVNATVFGDNRSHLPLIVTDDGHATQSKWQFVLTASGQFYELAAVADGTVHVTVEAHRMGGDLPAEPPHPDWYADTATYHVGFAEETANNAYQATYFETEDTDADLQPRNPIPPGTEEVLVRVTLDGDSATAGSEQTAPRVRLYYETDTDDWGADWREAEPAEANGSVHLYRIPVSERMRDSLYTCQGRNSTWSFEAEVDAASVAEDEPVLGTDVEGVSHFAGQIRISVAATMEPGRAWSDLAPSDPAHVPGCGAVHDYYEDD